MSSRGKRTAKVLRERARIVMGCLVYRANSLKEAVEVDEVANKEQGLNVDSCSRGGRRRGLGEIKARWWFQARVKRR